MRLIFLYIVFFAIGCKPASTPDLKVKQQLKDSIDRLSILKNSHTFDSAEQKKAINEITFGSSGTLFEKQKKAFLKKTEFRPWKDSEFTEHKLGEYAFENVEGLFYKDSLYSVELKGDYISYENYNSQMIYQYRSLLDILTMKYGEPRFDTGVPAWSSIEKGYSKTCIYWEIGDKTLDVQIECSGIYYLLNLIIYKPDIEKRVSEESQNRVKESNQKGTEKL